MRRSIDAEMLRKSLDDMENKVIIAAGFGGGKVIYKGHDVRIEKGHIRVTDIRSGVSWTEDTLTEAKLEINKLTEIRDSLKRDTNDRFDEITKEVSHDSEET